MLDTSLRKVAKTVLKIFGTDVTMRRVTPGAYSTVTRTVTPSNVDTVIKGRLDDYTNRELSASAANASGVASVLASDRKLTVACADLANEPRAEVDKVLVASLAYDIVRVETVLATDLGAIYVLQLRR